MVKNPQIPNNDPETRLLILHDSPQRGANNPVGVQSLTRSTDVPFFLGIWSLADLNEDLLAVLGVLEQPATTQLSILNAYNGRGDIRPNSFLDGDYRQMITFSPSGPQPTYPVIAAVDGSQCGRLQSVQPRTSLTQTNGEFFLRPVPYLGIFNFKADMAAYALPAYGQQAEISHARVWCEFNLCFGIGLFKVCIPIFPIYGLRESATSPANTLPYETLPGGTTNPTLSAVGCAPNTNVGLPGLFKAFLRTSIYNGDVCFVPTYSALDVDQATPITATAAYLNGAASGNNVPRLATFIANEQNGQTYNLPHLGFSARNAQWIFNEMQSQSNAQLNCTTECNPYPVVSISGPQVVCAGSTATFTVAPPFGAVTNWTVTPTGLTTTVNGGGGSSFLTLAPASAGSTGIVTITAQLSNDCVSTTTQPLRVAVGQGQIELAPARSSLELGESTQVNATLLGVQLPLTWNATFFPNDGSPTYPINANGQMGSVLVHAPRGDVGNIQIVCAGQDLCGNLVQGQTEVSVYDNSSTGTARVIEAYPNPTEGDLTLHRTPAAGNENAPLTVRLYDAYSRLRWEGLVGTTDQRVRTQGLPPGIYFLHVVRKGEVLDRQQLEIRR